MCSVEICKPSKSLDNWENTISAWVCQTTCVWVDILSGDNKRLYYIYQYCEILVMRLKLHTAAEEVLKMMEGYTKRPWAGLQ